MRVELIIIHVGIKNIKGIGNIHRTQDIQPTPGNRKVEMKRSIKDIIEELKDQDARRGSIRRWKNMKMKGK